MAPLSLNRVLSFNIQLNNALSAEMDMGKQKMIF